MVHARVDTVIISIINRTKSGLADDLVQRVIRAINRQIREDFEPYWGFGAQLRLEGRAGRRPSIQSLSDMRGDAVIYLQDEVNLDGALGYHEKNNRGIPYGFVFTELSEKLGENWTVTLSHEALELVGDPQANLLVKGPDPRDRRRQVFHWFEMCDAVQSEVYKIDEVEVSNFVLPLYFTPDEQPGGRNDFLGTLGTGQSLQSFSVNPGGYIGFYDPRSGKDVQVDADELARRRRTIKARAGIGRGNLIRHMHAQKRLATIRPSRSVSRR
jgi:hypothetical protein